MSNTVHAFDFIESPRNVATVNVLFGDDRFLKLESLKRMKERLFDGDEADLNFVKIPGNTAELKDIRDELSTMSLFGGGQRMVLVEDADKFVSDNRSELEDFSDQSCSGVLVLDVTQWRSNTRLYKHVDKTGLQIDCRPPSKGRGVDRKKISKWFSKWGRDRHGVKISQVVMEYLVELVGTEFGLLDQSLAKLALYPEVTSGVDEQHINQYVGGWQTQTIWELVDAAVDGHLNSALNQLDRLMSEGESPQALFGQLSWSLRRYAIAFEEAGCYTRQGSKMNVEAVLDQAGFRFPPERKKVIGQLKRIGRERGNRLFKMLLECDLSLKSSHSTVPRARIALEKLIVSLAGV